MANSRPLLRLLLSAGPCAAFLPPSPAARTASPLHAGVNGDSPERAGVNGRSSSGGNLWDMLDLSIERWPNLPNLGVVDRSSVHYGDPRLDPAGPHFEEDDEFCYLDDVTGTYAGDSCFVSDSSSLSSDPRSTEFLASLPFNTRIPPSAIDLILKYLPFIMPIFAYFTYENTARLFDQVVELVSDNKWVAVDGGQYQAEIITPAINGLVVPSIALLFATMTSNTINTLRGRQLQIRTSLNTEANDMRALATTVDCLPPQLGGVKNRLREYLIQYASRVIAESRPGLSVDLHMFIGSMDNEMNGFLGLWNRLNQMSTGTSYVDTMLPASNYTISESHFATYQNQLDLTPAQRRAVTPFIAPSIISETYGALNRLRHERSVRLSALQSTYPGLHYVILTLLAGSICTVFLMETNQELLIFLSAIQLRILWSMLIGTFTALAIVNYDMRDPFRGSYNVAVSVDQFYTIREAVRATIQMEKGNVNSVDVNGGIISTEKGNANDGGVDRAINGVAKGASSAIDGES